MGKERGGEKGKKHTKNRGKWRNRMNLVKADSTGQCHTLGGKKMRREEGEGPQVKMAHQGKMAGAQPNFLKNFEKMICAFREV